MGDGEGVSHVTCRLCGRAFRSIGWKHLVLAHEFDPEHPVLEYEERFGVEHPWSHETREKTRQSYIATLERTGRRWTRERVIRAIKEWWNRHGSLDFSDISEQAGSLAAEARSLFGSWRDAVEAAGIDPDAGGVRRRWTAAQVLAAIRVEHAAGRDLSESRMNERFSALVNAARRQFGTWSAALAKASVPPCGRTRDWSREVVVQEIRKMGRARSAKEAEKMSPGVVHAAYRYFDGWMTAVEAAGFSYPARRGKRRWATQEA